MNAYHSLSRLLRLIIILMASSAYGEPPPNHTYHPPMSDQEHFVRVETGGEHSPKVTEAAIKLPSTLEETELDQVITLPPGIPQLRLRRYLPRAVLEQTVTELDAAGGEPAVELIVTGPTQAIRRWLVAGDPARNRLISLIGTWRYLSADDKSHRDGLFQQF